MDQISSRHKVEEIQSEEGRESKRQSGEEGEKYITEQKFTPHQSLAPFIIENVILIYCLPKKQGGNGLFNDLPPNALVLASGHSDKCKKIKYIANMTQFNSVLFVPRAA